MKNLFLLLSVSLIATGCQPVTPGQLAKEMAKFGGGTGSTEAKVEVTNDSVAGTWASTCTVDTNNLIKNTSYRVDTLTFTSSDTLNSESEYFSDSACTFPLYSQSSNDNYVLSNDALNGSKITITVANVSMLPETDQVAKVFKNQVLCQYTGWTSYGMWTTSPDACGIASSSKPTVARNGTDELYLGSEKYLKQ